MLPSWMSSPTYPWEEIAERYRTAAWKAPMLELVERIIASPYAGGLYATTSMHTLIVGQTPELGWNDHLLFVEPITDGGAITRIRFDFIEYPGPTRHWSRECAPEDAFATLERFLQLQRWFVRLPPPA